MSERILSVAALCAHIVELEACLEEAGTMIRDLNNGWPIKELSERPETMLDRIKRLLPNHEIEA